eukprot:4897149-Amphidinium_carterae.2
MPWPDQATSARVRSQSRGLKWADLSGGEAPGGASSTKPMARSAWTPTEQAVAGMRPTFYHLSHRLSLIHI